MILDLLAFLRELPSNSIKKGKGIKPTHHFPRRDNGKLVQLKWKGIISSHDEFSYVDMEALIKLFGEMVLILVIRS